MLRTIFLTGSMFLVGCATGLPKPPVKQVRMLDVSNQVCGIYDVVPTAGKPRYDFVRDIPLQQCDGSVCLSPVDFKKTEAWALNIRDAYTCKLKE